MLPARTGINMVSNDELRGCIRTTRSSSRQLLTRLCLSLATKLRSRLLGTQAIKILPRQRPATLQLLHASHQLQRMRTLPESVPNLELRHLFEHR
jgi:hypothetical protein